MQDNELYIIISKIFLSISAFCDKKGKEDFRGTLKNQRLRAISSKLGISYKII